MARARPGTGARLLVGALLGALLAALALAAHAEARAAAGAVATGTDVVLRLTHDDGAGVRREASLRCARASARAGGYLARRDAPGLCRAARRLRGVLVRGRSPGPCTDVYGGPQTARVRGRIGTRGIDRRLSRVDGCGIADWDRAALLLPSVPGPPEVAVPRGCACREPPRR